MEDHAPITIGAIIAALLFFGFGHLSHRAELSGDAARAGFYVRLMWLGPLLVLLIEIAGRVFH